jgi:hypothetical protein
VHTTTLLGITFALVVLGSSGVAFGDSVIEDYEKITMNTIGTDDGNAIGFGAGDTFGYKITNMGDIDGNGAEDFATIAFEADGIGYNEKTPPTQAELGTSYLVLMNTDSTVKESHELSNCASDNTELRETRTFGENLDYLGVINGNHTLLIADYWFSKIHVMNIDPTDFSHTCSTPITLSGLNDMGWPFTIVGDIAVDGDLSSVPDLMVGAAVGGYRDDVGINMYLLDLTVDSSTFEITATKQIINDALLGSSWGDRTPENAIIADVDGASTTTNLVLGEPRGDWSGTEESCEENPIGECINGYVHVTTILDSANAFTKVNSIEFVNLEAGLNVTQTETPHFGIGLANMGDLDGNGVHDIAVGIEFLSIGSELAGGVAILFLDNQGNVENVSLIANGDGEPYTLQYRDFFGKGIDVLNIDNTGVTELAVSAHEDDTGANDAGAVYILTLDQSNLPSGVSYDMTPTPIIANPSSDNFYDQFSSFVNYAYAEESSGFKLIELEFTSTITVVDDATTIQQINFDVSDVSITYCDGLTIDELISSGNYTVFDNRDESLGSEIKGTSGNDLMIASDNGDTMFGKKGDDCMIGGAGDDIFKGRMGDDTIYGNDGDDELRGNQGSDIIYGGLGNDKIFGGKDNDFLYGNEDDDLVNGKKGTDTCDGGSGINTLKNCEL